MNTYEITKWLQSNNIQGDIMINLEDGESEYLFDILYAFQRKIKREE